MSQPSLKYVTCVSPTGLHRMAYWDWGAVDNPRVLVCVHGLARQGRDFDELARDLSADYRVVCPDVAGRGRSERLRDPMAYSFPTYVSDMVTLLARLGVEQVDWVGTSMGGIIGLLLAAQQDRSGLRLVRKLVLNDVGPGYEQAFVDRLKTYLGYPVHWRTAEEAADALQRISQGFGPHTPEQWMALTRPMLVPERDGYTLHYDPAIAVPIRSLTAEAGAAGASYLWSCYSQIVAPTLVLRGSDSDLLTTSTAVRMSSEGPRAQVREFAGVGHAPTLVHPDQRAVVRQFLIGP